MKPWQGGHRRARRRRRTRSQRRGQISSTHATARTWRTQAAERKRELTRSALELELAEILEPLDGR